MRHDCENLSNYNSRTFSGEDSTHTPHQIEKDKALLPISGAATILPLVVLLYIVPAFS